MARGFTIFALWMALFAVGYDRLVKVASTETQTTSPDDTGYHSTEGGDGLPPCCR
jgi:hypothetical protein